MLVTPTPAGMGVSTMVAWVPTGRIGPIMQVPPGAGPAGTWTVVGVLAEVTAK